MNSEHRIMVFSAHVADFCSRSGGTLAKYAKSGSKIRAILLSYGERGESDAAWQRNDMTLAKAKDIRRHEALEAAEILGIEVVFMDFGDYPLEFDIDRYGLLVKEVKEFEPNILLTHWYSDPNHPDHEATFRAAIKVLACADAAGTVPEFKSVRSVEVFLFESSIPRSDFNEFRPDTYVNITEEFDVKMKALSRFPSQPYLTKTYKMYAEYRGWQARNWSGDDSIQYAEAFKRWSSYVGNGLPLSM